MIIVVLKVVVFLACLYVLAMGVLVGVTYLSYRMFRKGYPNVTFDEYCKMLDGD